MELQLLLLIPQETLLVEHLVVLLQALAVQVYQELLRAVLAEAAEVAELAVQDEQESRQVAVAVVLVALALQAQVLLGLLELAVQAELVQ